MADPEMDALIRKVGAIDRKLDVISASVDERFSQVDASFAQVDEHFVEMRECVEFAVDRLRVEMRSGFRQLSDSTDARFGSMNTRFDSMDARFDGLERKLDQFIDTQLRVNRSDDARLLALEGGRRGRKR